MATRAAGRVPRPLRRRTRPGPAGHGLLGTRRPRRRIGGASHRDGPMQNGTGPSGVRLAPRLLWRVYVSDGHMELVRGAVFKQLDTRALRNDIVAAGSDTFVYNRSEPLPSAIVGPSLLFGELEIQRANRTREKLPQYPAPPLASAK